jgi:hypothetical protein
VEQAVDRQIPTRRLRNRPTRSAPLFAGSLGAVRADWLASDEATEGGVPMIDSVCEQGSIAMLLGRAPSPVHPGA